MVNLVANSRDAMPQGGRLTIVTEGSGSQPEGGPPGATEPRVSLVVADTGVGMNQATLQRIFEPFFTTKPEGQGVGLGLATVYGIVQQNRGSIEVRSEPGQGTTFTLTFPESPRAPRESNRG